MYELWYKNKGFVSTVVLIDWIALGKCGYYQSNKGMAIDDTVSEKH